MEKPTGPYTQSMETSSINPDRDFARSQQMGISGSPSREWDRESEAGIIGNRARAMRIANDPSHLGNISSRNLTRTQYASMEIAPPAQVLKAGDA
jgi:hypothetical protein